MGVWWLALMGRVFGNLPTNNSDVLVKLGDPLVTVEVTTVDIDVEIDDEVIEQIDVDETTVIVSPLEVDSEEDVQ